jgi:hypothetical protein
MMVPIMCANAVDATTLRGMFARDEELTMRQVMRVARVGQMTDPATSVAVAARTMRPVHAVQATVDVARTIRPGINNPGGSQGSPGRDRYPFRVVLQYFTYQTG